MLNEMFNWAYDYAFKSYSNKKKRDSYNELYNKQLQHYNTRLGAATSLFNHAYYRNYLDTPNARNMLKRVREQLSEQTRKLRNAGVVTGATSEAIAAQQKNNNKLIDNVIGTLANADSARKDRALENYANERSRLSDYLFQADINRYGKLYELEQEELMDNAKFWKPIASMFSQRIEDLINK